ncbi:MAG: carbohydrate binding domain-containing protein, partial [Polyangiales bacterium]
SFDVTCPGTNPCDGVVCDDTGNECTTAECNPDTGQCEVSDLDGNQCTAGGGGELAVNGGFEDGNLDGWTTFCDGPNNGTCEATTAEANTGSWSGRVATAGAPANPTIKQANLAIGVVQPNSEITIRFSMKGSTGPGGVVFAGLLSEFLPEGATREDLGGGPLFPTDQWVDYEFTTNTGPDVANGVSLELNAICGAVEGCFVEVFFDDVSIVIPGGGSEPGICDAGICVPIEVDLCEGNTCDDEDTECSDSSCDAGTGQCVATPINEGGDCEGGAGTCNAGVCEPSVDVVYEQNFNQLPIDGEFIGDGWLFFVNVAATVPYGYGGPAPNGPQICALVDDQGGPDQEPQQLSVYSDYNNADHGNGFLIETNVFQEPYGFNNRIPASEVGKTYTFLFQAKAGNIGGSTTANAFIKVLNPDAGFQETAADRQDTTNLPADWGGYSVSLTIDASWVGQILQYGFTTNATNFEPSGNFYDNVVLTTE